MFLSFLTSEPLRHEWMRDVGIVALPIAIVSLIVFVIGVTLCLTTRRRLGLYFVWISGGILAAILVTLVLLLTHG